MTTDMTTTTPLNDTALAQSNWDRYQYGGQRGHFIYCCKARRNDNYYLGDGGQWSAADLQVLADQGRPAYEFNEILPACNAAIGYQIQNRMDIAFRPRGGQADQDKATIRSKVAMQIADRNHLHWLETQVFSDGIIQQRGYYEVRLNFDKNIRGDIEISTHDPMDVIPDPDAKDYDPDSWSDVIVTRWLTIDEVEQHYGHAARVAVESSKTDDSDFGDHDGYDVERSKFGDSNSGARFDAWFRDGADIRVRIIDRQRFLYTLARVVISPEGDVSILPQDATKADIAKLAAQGHFVSKRMMRRVRWTVTTSTVVLHDDWSPYDHFTIVPYFAYFRRGQTRGLVDNAIGPQDALNKAISQEVHIVNTTANSGWTVEENTLTNMDTDDLKEVGASTGLVIEHKQGTRAPAKITPNPVPQGIDRLVERAGMAIKDITVPEAMRGVRGPEVSGIAIQAKQFASQQQLAVPLDNLARTRNMLAERIHECMQKFLTDERIFRITEIDPRTGKKIEETVVINQFDPETGIFLNDMTEGEYDVIVSDQPQAVSFENSQFTQALEMRDKGIAVPDQFVIRHSNLADKEEILQAMEANAGSKSDPEAEAKAALLAAQAEKTRQEAVNKKVEGVFSATQAANLIAANPAISGAADGILKSAGFEDANGAPIVPTMPRTPLALPSAMPPRNTSPQFPANPDTGMKAGIEAGQPA